MIIQIRGTSGSGKSTAMRKVIETMGDWQAEYVPGRKRPLYYRSVSEWPSTALLGHYEIACGGCDTIGSVPEVFAAIKTLPPFDVVLGEGLLLSEDVKWAVTLPDVRCVFLTTPVDECLRRVGLRQAEKGRGPADPERVVRNLTRRVETIERARKRLVAAGVVCRRASADQAPGIVLNWIRGLPCRTKVLG